MPDVIASAVRSVQANAVTRSAIIAVAMPAPPTLVARRMQVLLRQLLAEGETQRALERRLGISQSLIADYLSGKRNASARTAEKVGQKLRLSSSFFNDPRLGEDLDYHDFVGKTGEVVDFTVEPAEFREWEKIIAPTLNPPLQAHERRQMVAIRFHRGQLEKYSRLLRDLRDGVSAEEILAEEAETSAAESEAAALGVPARGGR